MDNYEILVLSNMRWQVIWKCEAGGIRYWTPVSREYDTLAQARADADKRNGKGEQRP